jgi:hypothetical protein
MTSLRVAPARLTGLGLLAAIAVTGCTSSSSSSTAPASPASSSAAPAAAAASASASPSASGFQNLAVTQAVRGQLLTAFAAYKKIPVSDINGSVPDSIYYGYDSSNGTYWAKGEYGPAAGVPLAVQVAFQDGGSIGMFKEKAAGGSWSVVNPGEPAYCGEALFFPAAALSAWSITSPGLTC